MNASITQFRTICLEEGTKDWLAWRMQGIGSSDAPVIMGQCPWKNTAVLADEKVRGCFASGGTSASKQAARLEPIARAEYSAVTGIPVTATCIEHREIPWLRASLDGLNVEESLAVEIKSGRSTIQHARTKRTPPLHYYGQLQHILLVTGYPQLDFWAYRRKGKGVRLTIERDEAYIERLFTKEQQFWEALLERGREDIAPSSRVRPR